MENKNLHPTVIEFKSFINEHPKLLEEIRKSGRSWQEYYEKWILLGEDDEIWSQFKSEDTTQKDSNHDWMKQIVKLTENVDLNKVQKQVTEISGTVSILQQLLKEHTKEKETPRKHQNNLFSMFRD